MNDRDVDFELLELEAAVDVEIVEDFDVVVDLDVVDLDIVNLDVVDFNVLAVVDLEATREGP